MHHIAFSDDLTWRYTRVEITLKHLLLQELPCGEVECLAGSVEIVAIDLLLAGLVDEKFLNHHNVWGLRIRFPGKKNQA